MHITPSTRLQAGALVELSCRDKSVKGCVSVRVALTGYI